MPLGGWTTMPRIVAWSLIVLVAAGGLTACGDEDEHCLSEWEGDLSFYFDPQLPSPPDSANLLERRMAPRRMVSR